jgi:hypothetical protein
MSKVNNLVFDFLTEIKDLYDVHNKHTFMIDVKRDEANNIDFKQAVITNLVDRGCLEIVGTNYDVPDLSDEEAKRQHYRPARYRIMLHKDKFDIFYKEKEVELREKVRCSYENKNCILYVNDQKITFSKNTGLILFFIYKSRIFTEDKSYHDYNIFIEKTDYNSDYKNIASDKFNRSIKEINERAQKETNGYIKELIAIKSLGKNKRNEYKWIAKI